MYRARKTAVRRMIATPEESAAPIMQGPQQTQVVDSIRSEKATRRSQAPGARYPHCQQCVEAIR